MPDHPASGQSGTGLKKTNDAGTGPVLVKPIVKFSILCKIKKLWPKNNKKEKRNKTKKNKTKKIIDTTEKSFLCGFLKNFILLEKQKN